MTTKQFNEKYTDWLVPRYRGLEISNPDVIEYLDKRFTEFIKNDNFKYYQIKMKFGSARFYADGLSRGELENIEYNIDKFYREDQ